MSFRQNKKYYIIAYNTYYEGYFKRQFEIYGNVGYTFRTRVGDLHLITNQTFFSIPYWISESKEQALLELGVRIYQGNTKLKRTPYSLEKHIKYVFKKSPDKLI